MNLIQKKRFVKNYVKSPNVVDTSLTAVVDPLEDVRAEFVWRWEVEVMDLLPSELQPKLKNSRSERRKAATHFNAVAKLLSLLTEAERMIVSPAKNKQVRLDKLDAKIRQEEEKFVKLETNEEQINVKRKREEQELKLKDRKKDETNKLKLKLAEEKKLQKLEAAKERSDCQRNEKKHGRLSLPKKNERRRKLPRKRNAKELDDVLFVQKQKEHTRQSSQHG
jgi:hypothetical protein